MDHSIIAKPDTSTNFCLGEQDYMCSEVGLGLGPSRYPELNAQNRAHLRSVQPMITDALVVLSTGVVVTC